MTAPQRAVVVGAGIAGLCAARVLADHFDEVLLLERDALPEGAVARRGVPQALHVHTLLMRGLLELERLLPGFIGELEAAGAVPVDMAFDLRMLGIFGWFPRHRSDLLLRCCSRALVEGVLRRRVLALPRIRALPGEEAAGLVVRSGAVQALQVRARHADAASTVREIEACLVVDASGRHSRLAASLTEAEGSGAPMVEVDAFLGYATRVVRAPSPGPDWRALVVRNPMPTPRGGVIMPLEGGRWIVSLAGLSRDYPPTDEAGFFAFADSLADPGFGPLVRAAEPLTEIHGYRQTANRWRHVEQLRHWPLGFAAIGDAVCALNPLYAQGMSVAVLEAAGLAALLAERGPTPDLGRRLRGRIAAVLATPWRIATSEDYRYAATVGPARSPWMRALHAYGDRVVHAATRRPDVHYRWLRVSNLLDDPRSLFAPGVLRHALAARR